MKQHRQYSFVYWFPQPFNEFALIDIVLLINIEKTDNNLQVKFVLNIKEGYSQQKCFQLKCMANQEIQLRNF